MKQISDLVEMMYNKAKFTFSEFIALVDGYSQAQFLYNGKRYGIHVNNTSEYLLFECDLLENTYQKYLSILDFANNANIDGKLLKDIWSDVYDVFELE